MTIRKSIVGLILGTVVGFIAMFVVGIALAAVFGLLLWDSRQGNAIASAIAPLFVPAGAIIGFARPLIEASRRQKERDEQQRREHEARQLQQQREHDRLKSDLQSLVTITKRTFLSLPELVPAAAGHLDRAEQEFADGVFAPFWDEVEHATHKLAAYYEGVRRTSENATEYTRRSSGAPIEVPKLFLPERALPDARPVAERLARVVRAAQKNFQFATIYEQRKTNQLLYAGFDSLGTAIYSLSDAISSSLQELSSTLHSSLDDLLRATRDQTSTMESLSVQHSEALRDSEEKLAGKHDEQINILEGMQQKRKRFP